MRDTFAIVIGTAGAAEIIAVCRARLLGPGPSLTASIQVFLRSNNPADVQLLIYRAAGAEAFVRQNGAQTLLHRVSGKASPSKSVLAPEEDAPVSSALCVVLFLACLGAIRSEQGPQFRQQIFWSLPSLAGRSFRAARSSELGLVGQAIPRWNLAGLTPRERQGKSQRKTGVGADPLGTRSPGIVIRAN